MNVQYRKALNLLIISTEAMVLSPLKIAQAAPALHAGRTCATPAVDQRLLATNPMYRENRQQLESDTQKYARERIARTGIARIPVVVHVVYNAPEQNISEAQIKSQIDILNKDFRKLNSDVVDVPDVFAPFATDARVEFVLACRDPNGNPTTGITRTATMVTGFSDDDAVKFTDQGGHDAWPADRYLNLWVADFSTDLLGYAQFPGGSAETDGIVILYKAFGNQGTAAAPFNLGRTATHEVGHWLNLYHIWGDDDGACDGSDEVADTPNQGDSNFDVPDFPTISCNNAPNGDMFMNYMDYVDDAAMFMFSSGQSMRMDAALTMDTTRTAILSSTAAQCAAAPPTVTTNAPSVITATSARLNGTINPNGAATTVSFNFGPTTAYGQIVAAVPANIAATAAATAVSANKTDLTCGTTYHYRVTAVNSVDTTNGADKAFTTSACPRDLIVTNITLNPAKPVAGTAFSAVVTVKNQGTVATAASKLKLWTNLVTVPVCTTAASKIADVGAIAAGASVNVTVSGLTSNLVGVNTFRAFADGTCVIGETNEANNQRTLSYRIGGRLPDLIITSITLTPAAPAKNAVFNAAITVKNQGNIFTDGNYLDVWTHQATAQTCGALGDTWIDVGMLNAEASKVINVTGLSAGATAGTKTLRAFVDSWCETVESNEANNQLTKAYTVQ